MLIVNTVTRPIDRIDGPGAREIRNDGFEVPVVAAIRVQQYESGPLPTDLDRETLHHVLGAFHGRENT